MPKRVERNYSQAIDQARIRGALRAPHPQNLLIIEAKKSSSRIPEDLDREKLRALKSDQQYRMRRSSVSLPQGTCPKLFSVQTGSTSSNTSRRWMLSN